LLLFYFHRIIYKIILIFSLQNTDTVTSLTKDLKASLYFLENPPSQKDTKASPYFLKNDICTHNVHTLTIGVKLFSWSLHHLEMRLSTLELVSSTFFIMQSKRVLCSNRSILWSAIELVRVNRWRNLYQPLWYQNITRMSNWLNHLFLNTKKKKGWIKLLLFSYFL